MIKTDISKLRAFYKSRRRMPSYSELAELYGFKSKDSAYRLAEKLIEEGYLSKDSSGTLVPAELWGEIKILGLIEAGFPSVADEETLDTMSLDEYLVPNKESSYILRVKGDSMINAGIREGDMVIVEKGKAPRAGEIVIARIDGGYTMKYYKVRAGIPYLEAANPKFRPIFPRIELSIEAVVKAVVRKYK
ncbi:MAG: LexA family transcriptional regulator [Candidatus Taylorbacteria bacterium]|nr:LexA family transcriptional regulator [Candidatus Taylorbacteria bacterium]